MDQAATLLVGGGAGLLLGSTIALGGRGHVLIGKVRTTNAKTGASQELGFGYGGVALEYLRPGDGTLRWGIGLLIGAGRLEVTDPTLAAEVATDNFVVVEPRLLASVTGPTVLTTWLEMSYRAVTRVHDLPGLGAGKLRGAAVSLGIRFDRLPDC